MNKLLQIHFKAQETSNEGTGIRVPDFCLQPLSFCSGRLRKTAYDQLFTQSYTPTEHPSYWLGLLSTESMLPLALDISFKQDGVYLIYLYQGSLTIDRAGIPLINLPGNSTLVCGITAGDFLAVTAEPRTCLLIAAMDAEWHRQASKELPYSHRLLDNLNNQLLSEGALPTIIPDTDMNFYLQKIVTCPSQISSLLAAKVENYLHKLYQAYEKALVRQHFAALKLWEYVHQHYTDLEALKEEAIQKHTWLNLKTANRYYVKAFQITIHQHALHLRMWRAYAYLSKEHKTVAQAAYLVGYTDVDSFSRAFSHFFSKNPSKI